MEAATARALAEPRRARAGSRLPDARLVARIRRGDEAAFEVVFDRYHARLLSFCRHMLGSREEAEDALQQVFVSAYRQLVSDSRSVELRPWLYAVARNRCLTVLRSRREASALDDVPEPSAAGLAVADQVERRADLRELLVDLARLPDEQRAALVLSELDALSHDEIATVLGVRKEKVKALVFQAREALGGWRQARGADCGEIREQLASLRGGALRRAPLRRHLDTCADCRDFQSEVQRQRQAMALLLPVLPTIALKAKVVGAVASAHAAGPVAGLAGVAATASVPASGGPLAALGGSLAAKAVLAVAVAGVAGGGYAVVHEHSAPSHPSSPRPGAVRQAPPAGAATPHSASAAGGRTPAGASTRPGSRHGAAGSQAEGAASGAPPLAHQKGSGRPAAAGHSKAPNAGSHGQGHATTKANAKGKAKPKHTPAAATHTVPAKKPHPQHPVKPVKPPAPAPTAGTGSAGAGQGTPGSGIANEPQGTLPPVVHPVSGKHAADR